MEFTIREYTEYREAEILRLYESVGWTNYTGNPGMLKNAYAHSLKTLGAYDGETLLGVIRAVGDGYSIVVIQDILVFPEYQRKGIGSALISKLLALYQKMLLTDDTERTIQFYKSAGFAMDTDIGCRAFLKVY